MERHGSREHFVKDDAHRVDVRGNADVVAQSLLGRHVKRRAHDGSVDGLVTDLLSVAEELGHAEIEQLGAEAARQLGVVDEEDVVRLEIAVNDSDPMSGGQRVDDLACDGDGLVDGHRAGRQAIAQALAFHQLHHEIDDAVIRVPEIGNVHDVRVADFVDRFGLLEKARDEARIGAQVRAQHLDGHPLADHGVLGQIDRTHASLSQDTGDLVVADAATDHVWLQYIPSCRSLSLEGVLGSLADRSYRRGYIMRTKRYSVDVRAFSLGLFLAVSACGTAAPAKSVGSPAAAPAVVAPPVSVALAEPQFGSVATATPSLIATLVSIAPQAIVAELDTMSKRLQLPVQLGQALVSSLSNVEVGGASLHFQQLWDRLDPETPLAVAWVLSPDAKAKGFCAALTFRDNTQARRTMDEMGSSGQQRGALVERRSADGDIIWTAIKGRTLFVSGSPEALLFAGGLAEMAQVRPQRGQVVLTVMPQALAAASGKSRKDIVAQMKGLMAAGAQSGPSTSPAGVHMAEAVTEAMVETALDSSVIRLVLAVDSHAGALMEGELVPVAGSELAKRTARRTPYAFDQHLPVKNDGTAVLAVGDWQPWMAMAAKMFEGSGPAGRATAKDLMAMVALTGPWSCIVDPGEAGFASLCSSTLKPDTKAKVALDAALAAFKSQHAWEAELEGRKPSALKVKRSGDQIEIEKKVENKEPMARSFARAIFGGDVVRSMIAVKDGRLLMASGTESRKTVARYGSGGVAGAPLLTATLAETSGDEMLAAIDVVSFVRRILVQSKELPGRDAAVMASAMPGVAEMSAPFVFTLKGGSSLVGQMQIPLSSLDAIAKVVRGVLGAVSPTP